MKETAACDWCITILVSLGCLKMTSKDKACAGICIFVNSKANINFNSKDLFGCLQFFQFLTADDKTEMFILEIRIL